MTNAQAVSHSALEPVCPLGELTKSLSKAGSFYRRKEENDPMYRKTTDWDDRAILACQRVLEMACNDKLVSEAIDDF